ncbi:MAG: carboxylating nicotinate-nucleotide diphosphorylase [bacterium JZ-2024 1]
MKENRRRKPRVAGGTFREGDFLDLWWKEDLPSGDITTDTLLLKGKGKGVIVAQEKGILAGEGIVTKVFRKADPHCEVRWLYPEGAEISSDFIVCEVTGILQRLFHAERLALNLLMHLSGVATLTRKFVQAVEGTGAIILDTRKTLPGLRKWEKEAVRTGGGQNHRFSLSDMLFLKSNHIRAIGSLSEAVRKIRQKYPGKFLLVEVRNLNELQEALSLPVQRILLDNFSVEDVCRAVNIVQGKIPLEVSGGINLQNVRHYAETGVRYISIGSLTHSAPAIPFSFRLLTPR